MSRDALQKILLNLLTAVVVACFLATGAHADEDRVAQLESEVECLKRKVVGLIDRNE